MQQSSTFQVYNASAGSGKTFTLVKEYLKVLLSSSDVFTFQKILAITFTNKAAGEMKTRVLKNLEDFSEGRTNDLSAILIRETQLDEQTLKHRSTRILHAILNNYSAFSITTIDSFTHKIIKNFAFDLGLTLNFEVELDATTLLNEAVDVLISKIGTDKDLTNLLIAYSLEKTDDDKSWDISRDLNEFAKILMNEDDVTHFKSLTNKTLDDFKNLKSKVFIYQKQLKEDFKKIGKEFMDLLDSKSLEQNDFIRGSIPKFFNDISQKGFDFNFVSRSETIEKAIVNHQYYKKTTTDVIAQSIEGMVPEIIAAFEKSKQIYGHHILCDLSLKSIIPLAVLNNINNELENIKVDNNIRLNAEFNQLISDNIKEEPAPFIYERIGQRFQYFFIDEMQDTSVLQWQNLIPLIKNALAQENTGLLLVGDGKQAIYRWRGGKAEQFINLSSNDYNPFSVQKDLRNLETNFRSHEQVIEFNNSFFQHVSDFIQNDAFKNLFIDGNKQLTNTKKGGFVSLNFSEKLEDKEEEKHRFAKQTFEKVLELKEQFSLSEICILTRKKKDGILIADYLTEKNIPIVSSETLLLKNNSIINFIIDFLKLMQTSNDKECQFEVLYFLYQHLSLNITENKFIQPLVKLSLGELFEELRKYNITFNLQKFRQLPLYEKVEEIIRSFHLVDSSNAYVQFFLDVILDRQRKEDDVVDFLEYWELKKDSLSIVAPENSDAVQIMTIHKSKGLEFPVVIFPGDLNIYREIEPKTWFSDLPEPLNDFNELLIPYNKNLALVNNYGEALVQKREEELELDNFNLIYVALTRAEEQLHILTERKISSKGVIDVKHISGIFIDYLKAQNLWKEDELVYEFGDKKRVSSISNSDFISENHKHFISSPWQDHNVVLLASSSKLWDTQQGKAIDFGNILHETFAKIKTKADVPFVLNQLENSGILNQTEFKKVSHYINSTINHPDLTTYYGDGVEVYNEREIITNTNEKIIPDRLAFSANKKVTVIDYKTGIPDLSHQIQIKKYASTLQQMNFEIYKMLLLYFDEELTVQEVV